jgi:hypothetical protein
MNANLVKCTCTNAYQDSLYGAGNRVGNPLRSGQLRCSVCGAISGSQNSTPIKEKPVDVVQKKPEEITTKKKSMKGGKR